MPGAPWGIYAERLGLDELQGPQAHVSGCNAIRVEGGEAVLGEIEFAEQQVQARQFGGQAIQVGGYLPPLELEHVWLGKAVAPLELAAPPLEPAAPPLEVAAGLLVALLQPGGYPISPLRRGLGVAGLGCRGYGSPTTDPMHLGAIGWRLAVRLMWMMAFLQELT